MGDLNMQSTQQPTINEIRVSGGTHPTTLSGYIHTSLNAYDRTCVVAVGPKAISTAMKAIAVARLNIVGTGKDIIALPEFAEIIMDDIKVNGVPLNSEGKDVVGEALEMAVKESKKDSKEEEATRIHVGMKIFLEQINRVIDTLPLTDDNQTRNNPKSANPVNAQKQNYNKSNKGNTKRDNRNNASKKSDSNVDLFSGKQKIKPKSINSHGIPRI